MLLKWVLQGMRRAATGLVTLMVSRGKDFARLMVTSEFAEGDLKSAVICRPHYGLKREYNVVV